MYGYTIIAILLMFLVYEIGKYIYISNRKKYYEKKTYEDFDVFKRDVNFEYTPSIASYLINKELKISDVLADILNLYAIKIIDIKKGKDSKYVINLGEKYNTDKSKLSDSERYLLDRILATKIEFDFLEWREKVLSDYTSLGLFEPIKFISNKTYYIIMSLIILLEIITITMVGNSIGKEIIISILLGTIVIIVFYYTIIKWATAKRGLSKKGKEELKKCIKFKNYIEEYTLLEERNVEHIKIYEQYIPYAIALGVNKKCSGTIFEIFDKETIQEISEDIFFAY